MRRFASKAATTAIVAAMMRHTANKEQIVSNIVNQKSLFDKAAIEDYVTRYMRLGFDDTYVKHFNEEEIANHVYGYMAARTHEIAGGSFHYRHEGEKNAYYFCGGSRECQHQTVHRIEDFLNSREKLRETHAISVRSYHGTTERTTLYTVRLTPYINPKPGKGEKLETLTSKEFLEERSESAKQRYGDMLNELSDGLAPSFSITPVEHGEFALTMAFFADRTTYFMPLMSLIWEIDNAIITKKFMESFSNGSQAYTFYISGATAEDVERKATLIGMLPNRPNNAISEMFSRGELSAEEAIFSHCIMIFAFYFTPPAVTEDYRRVKQMIESNLVAVDRLNAFRNTLSQEIRSERYMGSLIQENASTLKAIFAAFRDGDNSEETVERIRTMFTSEFKRVNRPQYDYSLMETFLRFGQVVLKHNFFKVHKAAISFRLDPAFLTEELGYPRVPHGVFLQVGALWRGFHVRFTDIARGGVRLIDQPPAKYKENKLSLFQENYNLAHTQLLKNKDIPEGGSKGTILISTRAKVNIDRKTIFLQYVDALLDVILPDQAGVVDRLGAKEIIFLGPDENTAGDYPAAAAMHAKSRGYEWWQSFTTGKSPSMGGIPHDTYGMTTRTVRVDLESIYEKLGLKEETLTKFQTGGTKGDLGSNEILRSKEKYVALVDGAAVVYDPNGVNREELTRLVNSQVNLDKFNPKLVSAGGFVVRTSDKNITLPDGTFYESGSKLRDEFHFTPYSKSDVFVPCGGRPRAINLDNVHKLINRADVTGEMMLAGKCADVSRDLLKYKIIVEGANLFITNDARIALERAGVVLIKDATANKGGVTSSSLEVLAGLALKPNEFKKYMNAKDKDNAPDFYKEFVEEICVRLEENAKKEFNAIWNEYERNPTVPKSIISDKLSAKIVEIRGYLLHSSLMQDKKLMKYILDQYIPLTLKSHVAINEIMERVPSNYQHAIAAIWLASHYVYAVGIHGTEFDFFTFMREHLDKAHAKRHH